MPRTRIPALATALALCAALPPGGPAADDWAPGEKLAYLNCGRCHVIGERNRMGGIGSTPSFASLRADADWEERMRAFYTLNPHPAFSQVDGVTPPFDPARPSPIHPLRLTRQEIEVIIDYARTVAPKDLGAPVR